MPACGLLLGLSALVAALSAPIWSAADEPARLDQLNSGFKSSLPTLQPRQPRGEKELGTFIESLSTNDAAIEIVIGQGRLLTLKKGIAVAGKPSPLIAIGDPSVIDFEVIGTRHLRVTGRRIGITDLSIITSDRESMDFEVRVVADLDLLRAKLRQLFPDADLQLAQIRDHVVVDGQANTGRQVAQIIATIETYLLSIHTSQLTKIKSQQAAVPPGIGPPKDGTPGPEGLKPTIEATIPRPRVINLIRVLGPQQVMLKVQVAELN